MVHNSHRPGRSLPGRAFQRTARPLPRMFPRRSEAGRAPDLVFPPAMKAASAQKMAPANRLDLNVAAARRVSGRSRPWRPDGPSGRGRARGIPADFDGSARRQWRRERPFCSRLWHIRSGRRGGGRQRPSWLARRRHWTCRRSQSAEIRAGRNFVSFRAKSRRQFRFDLGDGPFQRLRLAFDRILWNRRIEIAQLSVKRPARAFVNGLARFGSRIRQARDGLGEKRVVVSHFGLRAFERPSVNPALKICPISLGKDRKRESYRHVRDWSREAPPAPRSAPRSAAHI